jgi:hypothetical protein
MEFRKQKISFVESSNVCEGVNCSVYSFEGDTTKDLGVVTVKKGYKTPLQKVLAGDKTLEIFQDGKGSLTVTGVDSIKKVYDFPSEESEVEVKVGELMQWEAFEDLTFAEVCYPPYQDGRFENIKE